MRTVCLTTLMDQATELLSDLARDREPILITRHGLPSACLVDAETYRAMQERLSILEGIARCDQALAEGRTVAHAQARRCMGRWLNSSGRSLSELSF
ncbi:type II toxin-antitoxin system Phd/YefM family antitoxin [Pseudoxanthomonas composti]|uniref:Antitoxin n=1 Tax=Pseudoxanthomonas composti TaxID=2137479 RepID=A0A4Q1JWG3_9GAMM|nr:type II toxin-antitoxin system prevent-host-death family antitoxin [Pseudoxanthomonas composti]RXR06377.1 type II toxin-antitoxin system prevent-host-death family antitoxin [Pseudoxanthomonas composti]